MCVTGQVLYKAAEGGRSGFTVNNHYPIIGLAETSGNVVAIVLDDNGELATTHTRGEYFEVTELYAPYKVV